MDADRPHPNLLVPVSIDSLATAARKTRSQPLRRPSTLAHGAPPATAAAPDPTVAGARCGQILAKREAKKLLCSTVGNPVSATPISTRFEEEDRA
jgi:hypothetical protein